MCFAHICGYLVYHHHQNSEIFSEKSDLLWEVVIMGNPSQIHIIFKKSHYEESL